jgi:polyhydroxyalkanoate synthesis regulator protein
MGNEKKPIKKYGNRKLYDEGRASYISMVELSDMVYQGDRVEVVCDLTGRDLTLESLGRSLYERLKVRSRSDSRDLVLVALVEEVIRKVLRRKSTV